MQQMKGYTLIEMLVVMMVLSLLAIVIPPYLPNVITSSTLKSEVREVAALLKQTRSLAITQQQETRFDINVDNQTIKIGNQHTSLNLPKGAQVSLITASSEKVNPSRGAIRFFADGSSTGGRINIQHGDQIYRVDVNWLTGKVTITS